MAKMVKHLIRSIDRLSETTGRLTSYLIYAILTILVFEITSRYVFNAPTIWVHEATSYLFGFYFLLGSSYCLRNRGMIGVDIIHNMLPVRAQAAVDIVFSIFFFVLVITLVWAGTQEAIYSWSRLEHSNTTWSPPLYPLKTAIPIGAFLLLLQGIVDLIRNVLILVGSDPSEF